MNNESTNTFSALTTANIATLAASDNLDDNQLADRLARRLVLEVTVARGGTLSDEQEADLVALVEVTDSELPRI
jgi:hypothetical protein